MSLFRPAAPTAPSVLRSMMRRHLSAMARVFVVSGFSEGVELLVPIAMGIVIDIGIVQGSLPVTLLGAAAIIALRVLGVFAWANGFTISQRARMLERHRIRVALAAATLDPGSRHIDRPAGEILSIATSDADNSSEFLDMLPWVLPASAVVLATGVWFAILDPLLGLAMLVGLVAVVIVIRVITPSLSRRYDAQQSQTAEAAATATDLVQGLRVLQGLGVQSRARALYRRRSRIALDAALVNARFSGVSTGLTTFITAVMLAAVVLIAAERTLAGDLTIGTLIAVAGVSRSVMGNLQGLAGVPVWWASISTSARRVRDLFTDLGREVDDPSLSIPALRTGDDSPSPRREGAGPLHVRVPSVGIDVRVQDGEVVALVCADVHDADAVMATLHTPGTADAADSSHLGERRVTAATLPALRPDLLVEPHLVDLFDGSLRDQLATRAPAGTALDGSDDSWADRALHAAGAEDLLRILPEGYDTRILDRGANLSGGQKQRIGLARAVASDVPVLVLHDPTTAVDAVTEARIAEALVAARRVPDRATLLVTRSPSLLRSADRIVFAGAAGLREGEHEDLLERSDYLEAVQR